MVVHNSVLSPEMGEIRIYLYTLLYITQDYTGANLHYGMDFDVTV